jgi:diaminopimelate epimerase
VAHLAELSFTKGHGTANDFIVIQDTLAVWSPTVDQVRWLCDRRRGLGADGVIRVVPTSLMPELDGLDIAPWFMDYRNADGSIAEMCGNGARVFARYLAASGLETNKEFLIATRAGLHEVEIHADLSVSVSMGMARKISDGGELSVHLSHLDPEVPSDAWPVHGVLVPNPHAVVYLPDDIELAELDLCAPRISPADVFPDGVNIEFVQRQDHRHVAMRVVERGSGETLSCGTGACAVAWIEMQRLGDSTESVRVDVPGGTLWVSIMRDQLWLRGPADLVARGKVLLPKELL